MSNEQIVTVCRSWVAHRDQLQARNKLVDVPQREFIDSLKGHAKQLGDALPSMSLAEVEGLSQITFELVESRRRAESVFKK